MIPKIIHYCWFGGKELPELAKYCLASWEKYCPDYEIIRWDESNFDLNENSYVKEAYEHKKWAFITDYVRLKALYEIGGIYMDTDVELVVQIISNDNNSFQHIALPILEILILLFGYKMQLLSIQLLTNLVLFHKSIQLQDPIY